MISPQQLTAAQNIRRAFLVAKLRYAILKAQCQSGKTGAFQELIRLMLLNGDIQRAYILCGSSEVELRSQAIEDTKKHNAAAYARGDIVVLFHQDFKDATMDVTNALIIVDESHLVQTKGQHLDRFLARHGLSMDGNDTTMNAKNTFIVSVDATPYSELAALAHGETHYKKHIEELAPGSEYVGIAHYLYTGRLKPTFDVSREPHRFVSLFGSEDPKYALIRLSPTRKGNKNPQEIAIEHICRAKGYRLLYYTADKTQVAITRLQQVEIRADGMEVPCLEDAPTVHTVVIIRGRLRAGKVVPKKHIAFVWEGAANSKTDALIQGLPGRMCGYYNEALNEEGDPTKLNLLSLPMLFTPASALERKEKKVVKSSEIERAILVPDLLPTKATNLKKPRVDSLPSNGRTACVPLRLVRDVGDEDLYVEAHDGSDDRISAEYLLGELKQQLLAGMAASPAYTVEQKKEIQAMVEAKKIHGRWIRPTNAASHKQALEHVMNAFTNQTAAPNHVVSQHDGVTFFVICPGLSIPGANTRHVYAVFYTKAEAGPAWIKTAHLKSRIPETNGRSIFSFSEHTTAVPLAAAGATGFSDANLKSPEDLEKAMHAYLTHWRTSELTVSREIQSASDRFALDKKKFHYADSKNNDVQRICVKLGEEFGLKLKVKFARSSAGARGHFNVKSISW
jgi:hypothetical protein